MARRTAQPNTSSTPETHSEILPEQETVLSDAENGTEENSELTIVEIVETEVSPSLVDPTVPTKTEQTQDHTVDPSASDAEVEQKYDKTVEIFSYVKFKQPTFEVSEAVATVAAALAVVAFLAAFDAAAWLISSTTIWLISSIVSLGKEILGLVNQFQKQRADAESKTIEAILIVAKEVLSWGLATLSARAMKILSRVSTVLLEVKSN